MTSFKESFVVPKDLFYQLNNKNSLKTQRKFSLEKPLSKDNEQGSTAVAKLAFFKKNEDERKANIEKLVSSLNDVRHGDQLKQEQLKQDSQKNDHLAPTFTDLEINDILSFFETRLKFHIRYFLKFLQHNTKRFSWTPRYQIKLDNFVYQESNFVDILRFLFSEEPATGYVSQMPYTIKLREYSDDHEFPDISSLPVPKNLDIFLDFLKEIPTFNKKAFAFNTSNLEVVNEYLERIHGMDQEEKNQLAQEKSPSILVQSMHDKDTNTRKFVLPESYFKYKTKEAQKQYKTLETPTTADTSKKDSTPAATTAATAATTNNPSSLNFVNPPTTFHLKQKPKPASATATASTASTTPELTPEESLEIDDFRNQVKNIMHEKPLPANPRTSPRTSPKPLSPNLRTSSRNKFKTPPKDKGRSTSFNRQSRSRSPLSPRSRSKSEGESVDESESESENEHNLTILDQLENLPSTSSSTDNNKKSADKSLSHASDDENEYNDDDELPFTTPPKFPPQSLPRADTPIVKSNPGKSKSSKQARRKKQEPYAKSHKNPTDTNSASEDTPRRLLRKNSRPGELYGQLPPATRAPRKKKDNNQQGDGELNKHPLQFPLHQDKNGGKWICVPPNCLVKKLVYVNY